MTSILLVSVLPEYLVIKVFKGSILHFTNKNDKLSQKLHTGPSRTFSFSASRLLGSSVYFTYCRERTAQCTHTYMLSVQSV